MGGGRETPRERPVTPDAKDGVVMSETPFIVSLLLLLLCLMRRPFMQIFPMRVLSYAAEVSEVKVDRTPMCVYRCVYK